ncbi:putative membrane protein [Wickerhamomyces ciferrii]|uniref:Membrane protein n=1 Tax=Wickerhamomyces ciferrii (strain ATCC 14091 / BCRC 22168 / CBS 111 / JCM 3599 / NBRC 0793 / NRRL Y-1031 F-60-10) TaxID=1206466 RepID=K0KZP9_WICCF|nr:uncharacterized protein BN7_6228 [Wickerhamomyces ciferrii]CCH46633.1 putative membrane protein [Wickerhamomyces ciferrii]
MSSISIQLSRFNLPQATKYLIGSLIGSSLFLLFLRYKTYNSLVEIGEKDVDFSKIIVPYLQLIPNHTLFNPWTVVTSIFVETNIFKFLISIVVLYFAGKFIERSWSSKELIKYVVVIGGVTNLLVSLSLIISNIFFKSEFFNIPVDTNLSVLISFLVVLKQLIPEHSLNLFKGVVNARVKHLPFVVLLSITIFAIITFQPAPFFQAWIGFLVSWSYLRFFQSNIIDPLLPQPNDVIGVQRLKGDASETFSLVHFFPDALSPILSPIFNQFYELFVQLGFLNKFNDSEIEQGNLVANRRLTGQQNAQQVDGRREAERRRQVALKVLEERIGEEPSKKQVEDLASSST